jgi:hypothetical protein
MNLIFKSCLLAALAIFTFAAASRAAAQSAPLTNQPPAQTASSASVPTMSAAPAPKPSAPYNAVNLRQRPYLLTLIVLLLVVGLVYVLKRRRQPA